VRGGGSGGLLLGSETSLGEVKPLWFLSLPLCFSTGTGYLILLQKHSRKSQLDHMLLSKIPFFGLKVIILNRMLDKFHAMYYLFCLGNAL